MPRLKPCFIEIPLQLRDPNALAVLAMIFCLTPGTAWGELSFDRSKLLIHMFDLEDPQPFLKNGARPLRASVAGDLRIMTPILFWALKLGLFLLAVAMLCALARLLIGPSAQDRVMALDCLYINGMLMMLVLGINYASNVYFEAAMLIALFGFVASTALAKFLLRGEVIE